MKKTCFTFCSLILFSCQAGPLSEYDERIAREQRARELQRIPAQAVTHAHTPNFEYPPIEPLPAHAQAASVNEPDLFDDIKDSLSSLIEWFTS